MQQQLLLPAAETPLAQDEESSNASTTSLFSSISSTLTCASLYMNDLDAKIESATETLAKLTQDADAAMSKHDTNTALSIEIAATNYTAVVFKEIVTNIGPSTNTLYPHSPLAPSCQKESIK